MSSPAANCPNCGAPVQFRWSSAVQTACPFCHSILVRTDVDLKKVGEVADLPPDPSPIQLVTEGTYQGKSFRSTGRIIYEYEQGGWNEWHIVFSDGSQRLAVRRAACNTRLLASIRRPAAASPDQVSRGKPTPFGTRASKSRP